jgi:hypothetical protein
MDAPGGSPARRRLLIAIGILPVLVHLAVISDDRMPLVSGLEMRRLLDLGLIAASGLPHALIYLGLLAMFGATLRPGRDALVTGLARRMYGAIPAEMASYTRRVTWAWCAFFVTQLATSLILFLVAPLAVWSFFVNVLNLPLLALMFVAEQTCRPYFLRNAPRHSLADMLRMILHVARGLSKARSG